MLKPLSLFAVCFITLWFVSSETALQAEDKAKSYFLIGNSLTWDTAPSLLDGDVQWHVDCGKSLPYIMAHPEMPCVKTSTLWPQALQEKQYDLISVQSHYGATLDEDLATISKWVEMQPGATFIIHTGWARSETRAKEYASKETSGKMQHSPAYINALLAALQKKYPDRKFKQTHAIDLLDQVNADIENNKAPFDEITDIYRDAIHMKTDTGRYLMHNAMRHAMGQPRSDKGYEKVDPQVKQYLNQVLDTLK
ncbi:hypothetical protein [Gimesia sp.]|uniref:hypothetical protein n=1 Tax=Gimesia sp. TaxID=2024833 RepID=UPI000C59FD8D|nr:hypothetical protein [Gimesia sp.]MAX40834.1 hypothetical protein [Gimesia sp.]HAH48160.1 hypothetical protein [Planctomycetaceae bacterium]|tara:strand:+ start:826 stop:1581 length:756 start_codon:yes stop_codon:yes gene_type:complete